MKKYRISEKEGDFVSHRAELMKELIDRKADNRVILEYTRKMAGHTEEEKEAMAERFLAEIREKYALKPWAEYIREIDEKNDLAELKNTYRAYWPDEPALLNAAKEAQADNVVRAIAPHLAFRGLIPFGAEEKKAFPDEKKYEFMPICVAVGQNRLVRSAEYLQENVWKRYLYRNGYTDRSLAAALRRSNDDKLGCVLFDLATVGYRYREGAFTRVPLSEAWGENVEDNAAAFFELIEALGWAVSFDGVSNAFGTSGYRYASMPVPENEMEGNS